MSPDLILANQIIDGIARDPLPRGAVRLDGDRIVEVLTQSDLSRTHREGARVLDLGEATLLPGLIDTHVHLTFNAGPTHDVVRKALAEESDARLALRGLANAQAHLAAGVTTVRDVGGRGFVALTVRDACRDGLTLGPRIQASGPAITTTNGHLHYLGAVANTTQEVREWARKVLAAGADLVKICATGGIMTAESDPMGPQYPEESLRAAVEEAEAGGTLVAAHVLGYEALGRCVRAGVRSLEHCLWQDSPGEFQFRPELAEEMRRKGIIAGLTFAGVAQARYWEEVLGRQPQASLGPWKERLARSHQASRAMIDFGVRYVLHSDAGVRETPFGQFWLIPATACFELGISPLEAITAVTATAADLMGLAGEVGTLQPGARADLLAVDADPLQDIAALRNPRLVLQSGRVVAEHRELRLALG